MIFKKKESISLMKLICIPLVGIGYLLFMSHHQGSGINANAYLFRKNIEEIYSL